MSDDALELFGGQLYTFEIRTVHDKYQPIRVLIIVRPQVAQLLLSTHVPHHKGDLLVVQLLDVKANCGDSVGNLAQFEGVKDCGFARPI